MNIEQGIFGKLVLGLTVVVSNLMTAGTVFCLSQPNAALFALRRDKIFTSFQPSANEFEMQVTSRYDLQEGQSLSFSRMVDA